MNILHVSSPHFVFKEHDSMHVGTPLNGGSPTPHEPNAQEVRGVAQEALLPSNGVLMQNGDSGHADMHTDKT